MLLLFVLFSITNCVSADLQYPKCCGSDSIVEKNDSSYECVLDFNKRIQIVINSTNFVESGEDGLCVDVENSRTVKIFESENQTLSKVKDLDVTFYPKCCPLNYFYNSTTHGCVKSEQKQESFFEGSFVKVGLPDCKIIEDIKTDVQQLEKIGPQTEYCVDKDQNDLLVVRICRNNYDEVCNRIKCVRKCCPDGQSFINGSFCHNTFIHGLEFSAFANFMDNYTDNFAVIHDGFVPPIYALSPQRFHFHLDAHGIFSATETDKSLGNINVTKYYNVDEKAYCVEHAVKKSRNLNYIFFRGYPSEQLSLKFICTGVAIAISSIFLMLTILYYCISNEKKTLFGKLLISYCSALFTALLIFCYFSFDIQRPEKVTRTCVVLAFWILYLTLAVMTWMNVMCIDIYCTFGSSNSFSYHSSKKEELKRFILYSLHGWGTPLVLTVIPLVLYFVDVLPFELQIMIIKEKCSLYKGDGNYAVFLFLMIPLTVLQICNIILFIKTVMYCWQVKKEINKMNDNHRMKGERKQKFNNIRDRFELLTKLFFIMGISYIFEVVSTFYDFKNNKTTAIIEIIWDTFNCLQGTFIFVIFILKKRILNKVKARVCLKKLRKISLVSSEMTHMTSIPNINKAT